MSKNFHTKPNQPTDEKFIRISLIKLLLSLSANYFVQ